MAIVDTKRKIVYWDGCNVQYLPNVYLTKWGTFSYDNEGKHLTDRELILEDIKNHYVLKEYSTLPIPIVEISNCSYLVKLNDEVRYVTGSSVNGFVYGLLKGDRGGISLATLSFKIKELNLSFDDILDIKDILGYMENLVNEWIVCDGVLYGSFSNLRTDVGLSGSKLLNFCISRQVNKDKLLNFSHKLYEDRELSQLRVESIKITKDTKLICFTSGSKPAIKNELFYLMLKNDIPLKENYKIKGFDLSIRSVNTLFKNYYLGEARLKIGKTKRGINYQTSRYESEIRNFIPCLKVTGREDIALVLLDYCYYLGLSLLSELGIEDAEIKLKEVKGYPLFNRLGSKFPELMRYLANQKFYLGLNINKEKRQIVFLKNGVTTTKSYESVVKDIEKILNRYSSLISLARFLNLPYPTLDDVEPLYRELRGNDFKCYTDHKGNSFKTIKDMAKYWNISYQALSHRLSRGYSIEEALTLPVNSYESAKDHLGNTYPSFNAMCTFYGLDGSTVRYRIKKRGMSLEEALTTPLQRTRH